MYGVVFDRVVFLYVTGDMRQPGFEPGMSRPQREVLTTILLTPKYEILGFSFLTSGAQPVYEGLIDPNFGLSSIKLVSIACKPSQVDG